MRLTFFVNFATCMGGPLRLTFFQVSLLGNLFYNLLRGMLPTIGFWKVRRNNINNIRHLRLTRPGIVYPTTAIWLYLENSAPIFRFPNVILAPTDRYFQISAPEGVGRNPRLSGLNIRGPIMLRAGALTAL